ncbi:MAG: Binding-protein-dependent transport system inner rane component [Pedosphaera sp.]|nr:Binding-protein-dependent transport system inner rane component [Pedosphaera sp.]
MYFLRRIAFMVPLLLLISFLSFGLLHLAPGGPFDRERKPASPEIERNIARKYHTDEPFLKQYMRYLGVGFDRDAQGKIHWFEGGLIRGDFGPSYKYRDHSVNDIIAQGLPVSMPLGFLAFGLALGLGLPVGFITAVKRGKWEDYLGSLLALLAVCIPGLVIGPMLLVVFAIKLRWFPVALWESPWHAVLPTVALGLFFAGRIARLMREGMLNVMQAEFITAARAKGMSENTLLLKHAVRIAILPVVSYSGPMLADLLTGSFVIESIFQIPGLGTPLVNSSLNRDYCLLVGLVILYAVLLLGLNLLVDLAYMLLDRRVKYE